MQRAEREREGGKKGGRKGLGRGRRVDTSNLSWTEAKLLGNWLDTSRKDPQDLGDDSR